MSNARSDKPVRYFECITLHEENLARTIIERRYSTGELEYWGVINLSAGTPMGPISKQVPFKIDPKHPEVPISDFIWQSARMDVMDEYRAEAWANLETSAAAIEEGAKAEFMEWVKQQLEQVAKQQQREQNRLVVANAAGRVVGGA